MDTLIERPVLVPSITPPAPAVQTASTLPLEEMVASIGIEGLKQSINAVLLNVIPGVSVSCSTLNCDVVTQLLTVSFSTNS